MPAGTMRLVPDVALEADLTPGEYVVKGGSWFILGGTSGAAPQWAGYLVALNQQAGGSGFGNPGALLYGLCGTAAHHDVLTGSNGTYTAGPGYERSGQSVWKHRPPAPWNWRLPACRDCDRAAQE